MKQIENIFSPIQATTLSTIGKENNSIINRSHQLTMDSNYKTDFFKTQISIRKKHIDSMISTKRSKNLKNILHYEAATDMNKLQSEIAQLSGNLDSEYNQKQLNDHFTVLNSFMKLKSILNSV